MKLQLPGSVTMVTRLPVERLNLIYYSLIVVVLGVPLWWHTTDTYRATLPRGEINTLTLFKTMTSVTVSVCFDPTEVQEDRVLSIMASLKPFLLTHAPKQRRVVYDVSLELAKSCHNKPLAVTFTNKVSRPSKPEVSRAGLLVSLEKVSRLISDVARDIVEYTELGGVNEHVSAVGDPRLHSSNQAVRIAMSVATSYNVLVSVVNPDPAGITLNYNLEEGTRLYLAPFLAAMGSVADISYQTQVIRYVDLPTRPVKDGESFYIDQSYLPHLLPPVERKLGASTSNDLHLLLYLVEERFSPLYVRRGGSNQLASFLSPKFGAVILLDVRNQTELDHALTFSILLPQLKQLLGLRAGDQPTLSPKELYLLKVRSTLTHILRSSDTLHSLLRLVDSIPNMVIGDHIADQVISSVDDLNTAQAALAAGDLSRAHSAATRARDAAEKSFADPSILALLYFPDDQKFAIYIPLFLPVGLPLVVAYLEMIKQWRAKKKSE